MTIRNYTVTTLIHFYLQLASGAELQFPIHAYKRDEGGGWLHVSRLAVSSQTSEACTSLETLAVGRSIVNVYFAASCS